MASGYRTAPGSVVKSVLEATGISTVPTRTFRAAGVHTWVLTAEKMPTTKRFSVDADGSTCEILLQQDNQALRPAKGQGKSKSKNKKQNNPDPPRSDWRPPTPLPPVHPKVDDERIGKLEARFEVLEQRQTSFEARVDGKFDHISDSLRQLLAAAHPRAREGHGDAPPKFPKQA